MGNGGNETTDGASCVANIAWDGVWDDVSSTPVISVIMPVYNVAGSVERSVRSVLDQSLKNIELICVDDGSTDGSGGILDRIAADDARMTVIHQENGGAPAARNAAIPIAKGRYLAFFDADDLADPNMYARMLSVSIFQGEAREGEQDGDSLAELVICGFTIEDGLGNGTKPFVQRKVPAVTGPLDRDTFREASVSLFDGNMLYTPWNKLFLRERVMRLGLRFRDTFWDDFPFVLDYIRDVDTVSIIGDCLYRFMRERGESETQRWRPGVLAKREEEDAWMRSLYEAWGMGDSPEVREFLDRRHAERLAGVLESVCSPENPAGRDERRDEVLRMLARPRNREALVHACGIDAVEWRDGAEAVRQNGSVPPSRSGKLMRMLMLPMARGNVSLSIMEGRMLSYARRNMGGLFARLKARRDG